MIIIKPHHFIDIIKLYGAGIENFVPDEAFHHDFYKIANEIINNPKNSMLQLTVYADDICKPCNNFDGQICIDPLEHIEGFYKKDTYNQEIDKRIIHTADLDTNQLYSAKQLLELLLNIDGLIFRVWKEESNELVNKRNKLFEIGGNKLLQKQR